VKLPEYKRRSLIPLSGLLVAAYYLLVFVPFLERRNALLDAPLAERWKALVFALGQTNATTVDFQQITNQLDRTRQGLAVLEQAKKRAAARLELSSGLRDKLRAPFSLVEYDAEREKVIDELNKLAKQQQVTIDPAVFYGFPEQTADVQQPALLWAGLSLIEGLLTSAMQSKVSVVHSLEAPLALTNALPSGNQATLAEIPLQIELTGPVSGLVRWVGSLPLRGEEMQSAGLPQVSTGKLPLFVDRLVIKKQSPDQPDEVRVWLRVIGFIPRE
jgi:hypothetical protein